MSFNRSALVVVSAVASLGLLNGAAEAGIVVDDLSTRDPTKYPAFAAWGGNSPTINEVDVASAVGGYRLNFISAGPRLQDGPNVTPVPSATLNWNPGVLTYAASQTSVSSWVIGWARSPLLGGTLDLNVTGEPFLAITYSSTGAGTVIVNFANRTAGGTTTGGNDAEFVLPAGSNATLLIPVAAVNTPESAPPGGVVPPPADLSSLDLVLLEFFVPSLNETITLDHVAFVPEPASLATLALAAGALLRRGRRPAG